MSGAVTERRRGAIDVTLREGVIFGGKQAVAEGRQFLTASNNCELGRVNEAAVLAAQAEVYSLDVGFLC
jgi:hypothetical protein